MQRRITSLLALALSIFASGCFASRSDIDTPLLRANFETLEIGSTAREVVAVLGAPTEVVQLGTRSAYLYRHTSQKRTGVSLLIVTVLNEDTQNDRSWLFFDENDRLTHVGSSFNAKTAEFSLPFE